MKTEFLKEILGLVINHIDSGIHIVDKDSNTIHYNQSMAKMEGLETDQVMDKRLLDAFPFLSRETSTLIKVLETGNPIVDQRQTYLNMQGKKISTLNTTLPIIIDGQIHGAVEISKDITNMEEMSEKIMDLQKEIYFKKVNSKNGMTTNYTAMNIIGDSKITKDAISLAKKAAKTPSNVMIYGETGTGKELFSQTIHSEGPRRLKPFIAQNCAALPESLLEGILFGTVKGGFTGAIDRPGLFEQACGGTLLLDEINSMGLGLQAKLLRVIQEGSIRRVGGTKEIKTNVRIISTTNVDPQKAVEKCMLREDLYFRLNVVSIKIAPLRDRMEDITPLINHFIDIFNKKLDKKVKQISEDTMKMLKSYNWPGNVRELQNTIESAMNVIQDEDTIKPIHLPEYFNQQKSIPRFDLTSKNYNTDSLPKIMNELEREIIINALRKNGNNISKTAKKLEITRQALQYKIKKYRLNSKNKKEIENNNQTGLFY